MRLLGFAAPFVAAACLTACGSSAAVPASHQRSAPHRPNIVFVLTDDLAINLLPYMPEVQALERRGATMSHYYVTDSLCCPSRTSIFTGKVPHDSGVFTNKGRGGGIRAFYAHDDERGAFNVHLQRAGYRTAMMGKYLNGYLTARSPVPGTYVPPGWSEWDVAGNGYGEFNYDLNQNGRLVHYGQQPADYLVDVMARKGAAFVTSSARADQPFFLELATFAPHAPYVSAPRYRRSFPGLVAPRAPSFDALPANPPSWLAAHQPLTDAQVSLIDHAFRLRAQDVQAVDDMIRRIENTLKATGQAKNTYLVFSSDNGYHMGEYRLLPGKQTAFDTDIHVPLVVVGPGIRPRTHSDAVVQNIDLAATFEQIAGTSSATDGRSLLSIWQHGGTPAGWRNAALVEHHGPDLRTADGSDPDGQTFASGVPTTYEAMRGPGFTYVEYRDGEREFYDLRTDPLELNNAYAGLNPAAQAQLHAELARMEVCHGSRSCWAAEHVATEP